MTTTISDNTADNTLSLHVPSSIIKKRRARAVRQGRYRAKVKADPMLLAFYKAKRSARRMKARQAAKEQRQCHLHGGSSSSEGVPLYDSEDDDHPHEEPRSPEGVPLYDSEDSDGKNEELTGVPLYDSDDDNKDATIPMNIVKRPRDASDDVLQQGPTKRQCKRKRNRDNVKARALLGTSPSSQ